MTIFGIVVLTVIFLFGIIALTIMVIEGFKELNRWGD